MPILIRHAKTSDDLDEILKLRYEGLVSDGFVPSSENRMTGKLVDYLDIFPDTFNFFALVKGQVRATLRTVHYSQLDPTMNLVFDFSEAQSGIKKKSALLDQLVLSPELHLRHECSMGLIKASLLQLGMVGYGAAFMSVPSSMMKALGEMGFLKIADDFESDLLHDRVYPCTINLEKYLGQIFGTVVDKEILKFRELFTLTLFEPGELLAVQGEKGQTAYLIEDGTVEVVLNKEEGLSSLVDLKKGQLIGELAMITREARTASLIAKELTTCYSIDRNDFLKLLQVEPYRSLDLFKICSKRLEAVNRRVAQARSQP